MPRAGHHYLVRLLQDSLGDELRYCEFYSPRECCRALPCYRPEGAAMVFQKNHDFDLKLPHLPGVLYLVQTRDPLAEALSDYELWRAVDPVLAGDPRYLPLWLGRKAAYLSRFRLKWLDGAVANRVVVAYEELRDQPVATLRRVLDALEREPTDDDLEATVRRQRASRGGGLTFRARPDANTVAPPLFLDFAGVVAGQAPHDPLLAVATAAGGAELDGNLPLAAQLWEAELERCPDQLQVAGACWDLNRRCGKTERALSLARHIAHSKAVAPGMALEVAYALSLHGEFDLALGLLERLTTLDPEHPPYHALRTHCLAAAGAHHEAKQAAATFVALARSCELLSNVTPDQRGLRADFRGNNHGAVWQSVARVLEGDSGDGEAFWVAQQIARTLSAS